MKTFRITIKYRCGNHIMLLSTTVPAANEKQAYERAIQYNGISKTSIVNL